MNHMFGYGRLYTGVVCIVSYYEWLTICFTYFWRHHVRKSTEGAIERNCTKKEYEQNEIWKCCTEVNGLKKEYDIFNDYKRYKQLRRWWGKLLWYRICLPRENLEKYVQVYEFTPVGYLVAVSIEVYPILEIETRVSCNHTPFYF